MPSEAADPVPNNCKRWGIPGSFPKHLPKFVASMRSSSVLTTMLSAVLVLCSVRASASDGRTPHQFNAWTSASAQVQVAPRWWLVPEVHWRRSGGFGDHLQEALLLAPEYRTGRWALQPGVALWNTHPYGRFRTPATQREHRTWVQLGYQHPLGAWRMDHRLRCEQRFLERHLPHAEGPVSQGHRYVGRLRYRARVVAPLNDKSGRAGEWQAILQKETMVRFGDTAFKGAFDQIRPAVHLGFRPWHHTQITAGYQLQYLVRPNGIDEEMNHTLMVGAFWRLPQKVRNVVGPGEIAQHE